MMQYPPRKGLNLCSRQRGTPAHVMDNARSIAMKGYGIQMSYHCTDRVGYFTIRRDTVLESTEFCRPEMVVDNLFIRELYT